MSKTHNTRRQRSTDQITLGGLIARNSGFRNGKTFSKINADLKANNMDVPESIISEQVMAVRGKGALKRTYHTSGNVTWEVAN